MIEPCGPCVSPSLACAVAGRRLSPARCRARRPAPTPTLSAARRRRRVDDDRARLLLPRRRAGQRRPGAGRARGHGRRSRGGRDERPARRTDGGRGRRADDHLGHPRRQPAARAGRRRRRRHRRPLARVRVGRRQHCRCSSGSARWSSRSPSSRASRRSSSRSRASGSRSSAARGSPSTVRRPEPTAAASCRRSSWTCRPTVARSAIRPGSAGPPTSSKRRSGSRCSTRRARPSPTSRRWRRAAPAAEARST